MRKKTISALIIILLAAGLAGVHRIVSHQGLHQSHEANLTSGGAAVRYLDPEVMESSPLAVTQYELLQTRPLELAVWNRNTPAALRASVVGVDASLLQERPLMKVGDRLLLSLFDDVIFDVELMDVTQYPNHGVGMTARLVGADHGIVYMAYSGGELRISAEVHGGNDFYVRYDPESERHIAIEVDRTSSDYKSCPTCSRASADALKPVEARASLPAEPLNSVAVPQSDSADDVTVDVMVVYTPAAKSYEGGLNGINNNINLAMQRANTAHGNSDTRVQIRLAHSEEVAYVENQSDMGEDLENLTFTGGAYSAMDDVHALRDEYKADFVCLFARSSSSGGIAWLLDNTSGEEDYAFNVSRVEQSDWTYTTVHEIGHNMGCGHSATQSTQKGPGLYSYSSGWQWADSGSPASVGYCSVMTYEDFDGDASDEYVRVGYFSNPSISYLGNATGHASNGDNARTIRNMRFVFEDYRIYDPDRDNDGMPDEWEVQYLGSTNALATADADNDGFDNLSEYISGTNPSDPNSFFGITSFTALPDEGTPFVVNWTSVEGRVYNVLWSDNLMYSAFTNHNLSGDLPYPANSYTDSVEHVGGQSFYRVDVRLDQ